MNKAFVYGIIALLLFVAGCDDVNNSSIPNYEVNLQLNLTTTYPTFRNSVNQFLLFKTRVKESDRVGYGGVFVCTGLDGNYYAFDMACPYEAKSTVRVYPSSSGLPEVVCEKCGTVFDVSYGVGYPASGLAKEGLKRYRTMLSGDNLYVYN